MIILSIDPSVANRTGWATYATEAGTFNWGYWTLDGMNFKVRCRDLIHRMNDEHGIDGWEELVAEWPMYYNNESGRIAAQQGYTINLAGLIMHTVGWFQLPAAKVHLYTAPQWKGSVPKQVTQRRFFKMFDIDPRSLEHDTIDAIMMLVYHLKEKGIMG
jgi:hypothetical protein